MSSLRRVEPSESPNQLTIEQLAGESGMSVRNIRAHQARGLLAPPEVRTRVGYYGPEHLARLRLIRELQDDGFNLGGIKRLLDDRHGTAERLLRFKRTLTTTSRSERAETLSIGELAQRFRVGAEEAPAVLATAQKLGLLVPVGEAQYEVPSPSLLAAAQDVFQSGISLREGLAILEEIDRHCEAISRAFVKLFMREVWEPFQRAGMPADRWPEIESLIGKLRPIAAQALLAVFEQRMSAQVEDAFGEITRRLSGRTR
ncbi:MAG: MerR family transcriptional regulator [Actinomycetota bacterium]|nr:MerR family transcriptional regulator [Actinomycetota bacterium]